MQPTWKKNRRSTPDSLEQTSRNSGVYRFRPYPYLPQHRFDVACPGGTTKSGAAVRASWTFWGDRNSWEVVEQPVRICIQMSFSFKYYRPAISLLPWIRWTVRQVGPIVGLWTWTFIAAGWPTCRLQKRLEKISASVGCWDGCSCGSNLDLCRCPRCTAGLEHSGFFLPFCERNSTAQHFMWRCLPQVASIKHWLRPDVHEHRRSESFLYRWVRIQLPVAPSSPS